MKVPPLWLVKNTLWNQRFSPNWSSEFDLTRSLREPGGPCTKSMEVSESCMQRVNVVTELEEYLYLHAKLFPIEFLDLARLGGLKGC